MWLRHWHDGGPEDRAHSYGRAGAALVLTVGLVVGWTIPAVAAERPAASAGVAANTIASPAARQLLDRYAPVVVVRDQVDECGDGEPYRPVPVDVVLGRDDVVLRGPDPEVVKRAPKAADLAGRGDGYYLDFPGDPLDPKCDYERWFRSMGDVPVAVNGRVATDPERPGTLVAQYWFWWVFNDWNDKHEGDWEMVQIQFAVGTPEEALATAPVAVAFAQHEGAEVSAWDDPKLHRDGDHVAVYPSQGSHAAYFTQSQWFGRSASAGFGCDNSSIGDGAEAVLLRPEVVPLTPDTEWLRFAGRWGERELSFNNGPTGPNMKTQWDTPVVWQERGRPDAVAIPPVPGDPETTFCAVTAAASLLFLDLLATPVLTVAVAVVALVLLVLVLRTTRWRGSPPEVRARRTAGQILLGPFSLLRRHPGRYALVVATLFVVLGASLVAQGVLVGPGPGVELTTVGALDLNPANVIGILVVATATVVATAWCLSWATGVTTSDSEARGPSLAVDPRVRRGAWRTLLTYVAIVACFVSILLLPLGLYLLARWSVATPAAVAANLPAGAAGRASAGLTSGRRWRALLVMGAGLWLATVPAQLLGAFLLLLAPVPFVVANIVALLATAVTATLFAISWTLHYYDLSLRSP